MLNQIEPAKELFRKEVHYRVYCLVKQLARYDEYVASDLHLMVKKMAVQMKHETCSAKDFISVFAFLQTSKYVCDACGIHKGAEMWL